MYLCTVKCHWAWYRANWRWLIYPFMRLEADNGDRYITLLKEMSHWKTPLQWPILIPVYLYLVISSTDWCGPNRLLYTYPAADLRAASFQQLLLSVALTAIQTPLIGNFLAIFNSIYILQIEHKGRYNPSSHIIHSPARFHWSPKKPRASPPTNINSTIDHITLLWQGERFAILTGVSLHDYRGEFSKVNTTAISVHKPSQDFLDDLEME